MLAALGSRLRSYWSPSTQARRRDRPSTASSTGHGGTTTGGEHGRWPQVTGPSHLTVPSHDDVSSLLTDDEVYSLYNVSRQQRTSPAMSSFTSFTAYQ